MSTRTIRVTVRGAFDGLTPEQRAELLARAPDHDLQGAAFTAEGTLCYDLAARPFFTFRYQATAEAEEEIPAITLAAEYAAETWLTDRGYGYKRLTSTTTDLSEMPLGARGRRAAARDTR
jgi:hypothetical protein